jgi:inosose dehydratase
MQFQDSRRIFLSGIGTLAAASLLPARLAFALPAARAQLRFGYTSITWGKQERQSIDDIAALGYPGIQMRADAVAEFKPEELRALLQQHKLTLVALSSGELNIDPIVEADELAKHTANAKFVHDVGGNYLQVLDALKPWPRTVTPDECTRLGHLLSELGKRTADLGIPLGYHNHINTISQRPDDLDRVMDAADTKYVKLELDVAHYAGGGGDPAKCILKYRDRLLFLHLKDVIDIPLGSENSKYPFKFVELGSGRVDFPAVFAAINQISFKGWAVVELDRVPDKSKTPKEYAALSKKYLEERIGVKI